MSSFWGKEAGGSVAVMSASHELVNDNDLDYNEDDEHGESVEDHSADNDRQEEGEDGEVDDAEDGEVKDDSDSDDEELIKKKVAEKQAEVRRQQLADLTGKKHPPVEAPEGARESRDDRSDDYYEKYSEETYEYPRGGGPPSGQQFTPRMRVDPALTVCKFYLSGYCRRGDTCAFIHMEEVRRNPNVPPHLGGRVGAEGEPHSQVVEVVKRRRVSSTSSDSSDDLPPARKRLIDDRNDRRSRDEPMRKRSRDDSRNRRERDRSRDFKRGSSRSRRNTGSSDERRRRPSKITSRYSDRSPVDHNGRRGRKTPPLQSKSELIKEKPVKLKRRDSDSSSSSSDDSSSKSSRDRKRALSKRSSAAAISSDDENKHGPRTPSGSPPKSEKKETRSREELVEQLRNIEEMLSKHKQKRNIVDRQPAKKSR